MWSLPLFTCYVKVANHPCHCLGVVRHELPNIIISQVVQLICALIVPFRTFTLYVLSILLLIFLIQS